MQELDEGEERKIIFSTLGDTYAVCNDVLGNVTKRILRKVLYFMYLNIVIFVNHVKSLSMYIFLSLSPS